MSLVARSKGELRRSHHEAAGSPVAAATGPRVRLAPARWALRADAVFLLAAAAGGMATDLRGVFTGAGPMGTVLAAVPHAGIGFVEAHGLALILGVLLWRAVPSRSWHATACAIHLLLGGSNLLFWPLFSYADMLTVGVVATGLHGLFALLQGALAWRGVSDTTR